MAQLDDIQRRLFGQNKLFSGLTSNHIAVIAPLTRLETFSRGDTIVRTADPPVRVFLLLSGRAQVRKSGQNTEGTGIADLSAGDFFGEMAVLTSASQHSSDVVALTDVTTCSLSSVEFTRLLADRPEIMRNILSNIILHLEGMNEKFVENLRSETQKLEEKVRERTRALEEVSQRIKRELTLAQSIQRNLLPEKRTDFPCVSICAEYVPCEELSGDITGVFQIDETRIGVYGGDVCGHGIYAAMVMSYVKKLIETSVKRIFLKGQYVVKPPGAVLTTINQSFISEISQGDPEIYLTLFFGVLDMRTLVFDYSSAGTHVSPLVISGGGIAELFSQSDFPIGHVPDHEYATRRMTFAPGDNFLFASDGVVEARRADEEFGMERLKSESMRILRERGSLSLDEIIASIRAFLDGRPTEDDMCLLSMTFNTPGATAA